MTNVVNFPRGEYPALERDYRERIRAMAAERLLQVRDVPPNQIFDRPFGVAARLAMDIWERRQELVMPRDFSDEECWSAFHTHPDDERLYTEAPRLEMEVLATIRAEQEALHAGKREVCLGGLMAQHAAFYLEALAAHQAVAALVKSYAMDIRAEWD